jgi:uncharacterized protein YaiL (DUF2058 family)
MSSLQEQLQKAGLVSPEKLKKVQTEARKKSHKLKKDKTLSAEESDRRLREQRKRDAELQQKRERDRRLNQARETRKRQAAEQARIRQLIETHRLNENDADIPYHFVVDGRFIRSVRVTSQQLKMLATGRLGVVRNIDNEYDFPLLARETVLKMTETCPDHVLCLHPESTSIEEE